MTETVDGNEDIEFGRVERCRIGCVLAWAARQAACDQGLRIIVRRSNVVTRKHVPCWRTADLMGA
jgi:hypothetical protein